MFKVYFYDTQKEKDINLAMSKQAFANGTKVLEIFAKRLFSQPFNLHDKLKKINLETLIIHGDYDIVPFVIAQKIHEDISNSKYLLLKNCGHFSYIEDAEVVFYHLDNFLHPKS
jgi:pimeloyl-ACP methyl ester carboxylesterase